jgi:hypothetical protein
MAEIGTTIQPTGSAGILALQRTVGNQAVIRRLMPHSVQRQEADEPPTSDPDAPPAAIPQVDMAPRKNNRAHQIDWDKQHEEIAGLTGDQTMREKFELNLFEELAQRLPDVFTETATHADAERLIQERILDADAAGNPEEAERLEREWNISLQFAVVKTLDVENSDRYEPVEGGPTYCNIYAYDVVSALGGYLPRVWWNDDVIERIRNGETVDPIYGKTIHEMNANALTQWFIDFGPDFGWERADDMTAAQDAANGGELAIIVAANQNPKKSGHITVVMPETQGTEGVPGTEATRDAEGNVTIPTQSQAGRNNLEYGTTASEWWENGHVDGGAYIFRGERNSQLLSPEQSIPADGAIGRWK